MNLSVDVLKEGKEYQITIDALVVLKIIKHSNDTNNIASGHLQGLQENDCNIRISNCFPKFSIDSESDDNPEIEMARSLRQLNFDSSSVGWYQATELGYLDPLLVEQQFIQQSNNSSSLLLVYDPSKTSLGKFGFQALRLTDVFMNMYKTKKFTTDMLKKKNLNHSKVFLSVPLSITNSILLTTYLHEQSLLAGETKLPLQTGTTPLERHLEELGDTLEMLGQEQWRFNGWQRNLAKEQQRFWQMGQKRKWENNQRQKEGLELLPVLTESAAVQKLLGMEPSRLDMLIIGNQIETYCKQINQFSGPGTV